MTKLHLIGNAKRPGLSALFETEKLDALLEEASAKMGRKNDFYTKKSFAPSGIGYGSGRCPRYWYLAFHGANFEYSNTAMERANMDSGIAAGARIAKLFENAGILDSAEAKVIHDDPPIFGYMDLAITWQDEQMIGEVKTTRDEHWNVRAANLKAPGYQLLQLLIYMKVFNKRKGFFVVENKNTHQLLTIPVLMTEENEKLVDYAFKWMRTVKKSSDDDELPKRPFTMSSMECKSCPVFKDCWAGIENSRQRDTEVDPAPGVVMLPPLEIPR